MQVPGVFASTALIEHDVLVLGLVKCWEPERCAVGFTFGPCAEDGIVGMRLPINEVLGTGQTEVIRFIGEIGTAAIEQIVPAIARFVDPRGGDRRQILLP